MRVDIRTIRLKRGYTQAELSRRSGVPQPMISDIESGAVKYPRIDTLYKLAKALMCSVYDFIIEEVTA